VTRLVDGYEGPRCSGGTSLGDHGTLVAVVVGSTAWRFEVADTVPTVEQNRFLDSVRFG